MKMTRREKWIAIVAGATLGLLVLDQLVLTPWLDSLDKLEVQRQRLQDDLNKAHRTILASHQADRRWRLYHAAGLGSDPSASQSAMLNAVRTWSQEAGLRLTAIRPDRAAASHGFKQLSFQATGEGSMQALTAFLYRLETAASFPVRVHELQITPRVELTDNLTVQMRLSTLWQDAPITPPATAPAAAPTDAVSATPAPAPGGNPSL